MSKKNKMPGLKKIGKYWHIDKYVLGKRICKSTYQTNYNKAEEICLRIVNEIKDARLLGIRPRRKFLIATNYYLKNHIKKSLKNDELMLKKINEFIGDKYIDEIHMGSLQELIISKTKEGLKKSTINNYLQIIRNILNLCASDWIDENGLTWLASSPKIKFIKQEDRRKPYPLTWEEQDKLFNELPEYLRNMALFKVNTGTRNQEVCNLKWEWEIKLKESKTSVFLIPGEFIKNGEDRIIVLNDIAKSVVDSQRSKNKIYVFTYNNRKISTMNNTSWRNARKNVNLEEVRVHDLKHTYGRRLRAAGVSMEDRQDLLGHKNGKITTHYSIAEIDSLINESNKILNNNSKKQPSLTLLKIKNKNFNIL